LTGSIADKEEVETAEEDGDDCGSDIITPTGLNKSMAMGGKIKKLYESFF